MDILLKLGLTAVLGLILGMERQIKRKPVGLKTSLVISIVSCLLTIVSIDTTYISPPQNHVNISFDPLRLAAQIVSGVGFLGAGVILRRENDSITGLTTAAIIWGAAGIGIAVGAGFFIEAVAVVFLIIISVDILPLVMNYVGPKQLRHKVLLLQLKVSDQERIQSIVTAVKSKHIQIKSIKIRDMDSIHLIQMTITVHRQKSAVEVYEQIKQIDGIKAVEIQDF
ncbi:MgtC/SapB family protein [Bacillus sp. 1P06AnD]|uniref:MgtC/SapB family protein n=1 Tax=Bacillus sp. 1P06AnD TaxID=3132208 RepID=UPI0039A3CEDF